MPLVHRSAQAAPRLGACGRWSQTIFEGRCLGSSHGEPSLDFGVDTGAGSHHLGFFFLPAFNRTTKPVSVNVTVKREGPFSVAEVAKHNKETDLWIILKNKVYDVTSFVEEHPGGEAIMNNAGADSTEGFFGPQHGTKVFEMLDDFYIGELAQ